MKQKQIEIGKELRKKSREKKSYEAAAEKFAANLAHELGNPLDGVRRYVGLALHQSMGEPLTQEYLLKAKDGIFRIMRIVRELLVYSKQARGEQGETVEIHLLLDESLKEFEAEEKFPEISIQKIFSEEGPLHVEDRGISIVLQNLYKNAAQAMKGRGVLTIATWRQNGSVGVAVQDTGSGVPESIKARIFEPFFSTKNRDEGMGIGLALSREIVERSGGELQCENVTAPVPGARFVLVLPRKSLNPAKKNDQSIQI